jgi:thioredoxin reductase (NADPH)
MYDVIIIGAGPAGLTAGLYAARANMKTLILEKEGVGGLISQTADVANMPGSIPDATGPALVARMEEQAKSFGAEIRIETVKGLRVEDGVRIVDGEKQSYEAKTVILAVGAQPRKLNVPGEAEFTGKGVGYCATCDGAFFSGLDIYTVGGGDTACEESIFLTKFAKKVTIIVRRGELRAAKSIQDKIFANEKIEVMWNSAISKFEGQGLLGAIEVTDTQNGEVTRITPDEGDMTFGVFIFAGYLPDTKPFEGVVEMERGYIPTNELMKTNVPGVYAAGDCRVKTLRQVVTATNDGAIAAVEAEKFIEENY